MWFTADRAGLARATTFPSFPLFGRSLAAGAALLLLVPGWAAAGSPEPGADEDGKRILDVDLGSGTVPVWVDRPLDVTDPSITRAMIVVHGTYRDAERDFERVRDVVPADWEGQVVVVAPYFQEEDDADPGELWWDSDWREGGDSGGVSSFDVADELVHLLRGGAFPNLEWIVVTGHSAGGQFTQRYAAFTDVDQGPERHADRMKFVPANPSSYVYLDGLRWDGGGWTVPETDCGDGDTAYNAYKYGLDGLYSYAASRGAEWPRAHLPARWVEVLAGTADVTPEYSFDESCAAMYEGPNRYERAHRYVEHVNAFYGPARTSVTDVPGVGHDGAAMFASPQGVDALFFREPAP